MKRITLILFLLSVFMVWPVQAQEGPTISSLEVSLWPEYDKPDVLVILRGVLAEATPMPVPVEILIPAGTGGPSAVAYVTPDGQRFNQEHDIREEGGWIAVSFDLDARGFQLEYYDLLPVDAEGQREYRFDYKIDFPVSALNVDFQVPPTATGFELDPEADSVVREADGLTYHLVQADSVAAGEDLGWTFRYQKDNQDLTVGDQLQPEVPAPTGSTQSQGDNTTYWLFLVAFVALIAVGGGAFWLGSRTQSKPAAPPPASKRQKRRGSGRGDPGGIQQSLSPAAETALFCYKCGAKLRAESEFCHKCGAEVREG
jgi:hypothetical protein